MTVTAIVPSLPPRAVWDIQSLLVGKVTLGRTARTFGTTLSASLTAADNRENSRSKYEFSPGKRNALS